MDALAITALASSSLGAVALAKSLLNGVTVGSRYGLPVKLPMDRHMCILGPTRSGKSSLVRYMIPRLAREFTVTVLDWHGEYGGLLTTVPANALRMRLREVPPKLLTEVLGFGLNLNEPSIYMLYRVLRDGSYDSMSDVVRSVSDYLVSTRTEAEMKAAILRRLEYVASNLGSGPIDMGYLFNTDLIIDMSGLTIIEEKRLMASLILSLIYMRYLRRGTVERGVRHIVIIEEAQNLIEGPGFGIVDHLVMELGKYGIRVILVSNIAPRSTLLKHCNLIIFKSRPELMGNDVAMSMQLTQELQGLRDGEALLITNSRIVRMRPRASPPAAVHIRVVARELRREEPRVEEKEDARDVAKVTDEPRRAVNLKDEDARGLFRKQIEEVEKLVLGIRDRLDQVERILSADERIIERILEVDERLKLEGRDSGGNGKRGDASF